jgi:penicillin-binding protein 2
MATHGKWIRPHLAKSLEGQAPVDPEPVPDIELRDPRYWKAAINGMEQVLHGARGTARKVGDTMKYRGAGKSGTAQVVAIKQGERYDSGKLAERHRDHALFVAFAPVDNPQIAVAVMVENGESGSGVAAPVAKQVMDAWLLDENGELKAEYAKPPTAEVAKQ